MQNEPQPSKTLTLVSNGSLKWNPIDMCIVLTINGSLSLHHMIQYFYSRITEYNRHHFNHRLRKSNFYK